MTIIMYVFYYILLFIGAFVCTMANAGMNTWQFWAITICMVLMFVCGYFLGRLD